MIQLGTNTPWEKRVSLSLFLIGFFLLVTPVLAGQVTITARGDQSYYRGEEITFSGTNTETGTTYLFLIGPNLNTNGAQLTAPGANVINQHPDTFVQADVGGDTTWSYKWGTGSLPLTAGTYTVYAVSYPRDRTNLAGVQYGTVSIIIKKPFIDAKMYQNGDEFEFTGSAEGCPTPGVQVWIIGENYAEITTVPVAGDCSFQFTIPRQTTTNLANGNYFILLQHPMQNDQWDIVRSDIKPDYVRNLQIGASGGTDLFPLFGPKSLKGSEAANALIQAINDPSVDDTFTYFSGSMTAPIKAHVTSITIQPIISQPSVTRADNAGSSDNSIIKNSGYLLAGILVVAIITGLGIMQYRKQEKKSAESQGQSIPSESAKRVCNRCGNTDTTSSRYCIVCGNPLDTNSATGIKPDIGQDRFDEDFQRKNQ
jgi:trimeric autotransporter adhesin